MLSIAALAALLMIGDSFAAESPGLKPSIWDPLRFLLGSWAGTGFEMADPNGEFELYSESRFKRRPSPTE